MVYQIERKNDLSGAMLIIRFPESDLDKKALYTIENARPPFLVPFSYRSVDGMAECIYHLENRSKLQYRFGAHSENDYIQMWIQILQPLLECDDWFMKPFSFVFDSNYIYVDKDGTVSYLYVPSLRDCEDFDSLRALMIELSRQNSVSNVALENQVLRHVMQDFQPKSFLAMLRAAGTPPKVTVEAEWQEKQDIFLPDHLLPQEEPPESKDYTPSKDLGGDVRPNVAKEDGEIHIRLDGAGRAKTEKDKTVKEKKPFFGGKKEKPPKERKPLFGGKKDRPKEVMLGAAEVPARSPNPTAAPAQRGSKPAVSYDMDNQDEVTQLDDWGGEGVCRLRLVGNPGLPREIVVEIQPGHAFTIGRFDVSVGHKQSDFEFDKGTKAVSRRHAAIERDESGYCVVDLASSAGTFVDGIKLIPNVPQTIENGSRISFGTGGADYIWSE